MELIKYRFHWSDHDLADGLGISHSLVSRYRLVGVPARHMAKLGRLSRQEKDEVGGPRRKRSPGVDDQRGGTSTA